METTIGPDGKAQVLNERYEVLEPIGEGAIGLVVKAADLRFNGALVALKLLHGSVADDRVRLQRFKNEIQVMRGLTHPNIVRVFEFGFTNAGQAFISMEYVDGETLRTAIARLADDPIPFDRVIEILYQIARGMAEAHRRGIIHRDLKPDNILLAESGEVKIADFGLAKQESLHERLTTDGQMLGTPFYMSPEQLRGMPVDGRSDIYSFGILAFELVSGVRPFISDSLFELASQHVTSRLPRISSVGRRSNGPGAAVPSWFQAFVERCAEKQPERRFQTFEQIADYLEPYVDQSKALRKRRSLVFRSIHATVRQSILSVRRILNTGPGLTCCFLLCVFYIGVSSVRRFEQLNVPATRYLLLLERKWGGELEWPRALFNIETRFGNEHLKAAIFEMQEDRVRVLLEAGIDPNAKDSKGRTPLLYALRYGNLKMVEDLLSFGAGPDAVDPMTGETPMMLAVSNFIPVGLNYESVTRNHFFEQFLAYRLLLPDIRNCAPLTCGFVPAAAMLLLKYKAPVHGRDRAGRSIYSHLFRYRTANVWRVTLDPADSLLPRERKEIIIHSLARLLADGVHPDISDEYNRTPLMYAAREKLFPAVLLLLSRGANIEAMDLRRRTALEHAAAAEDELTCAALMVLRITTAMHRDGLSGLLPEAAPAGG